MSESEIEALKAEVAKLKLEVATLRQGRMRHQYFPASVQSLAGFVQNPGMSNYMSSGAPCQKCGLQYNDPVHH